MTKQKQIINKKSAPNYECTKEIEGKTTNERLRRSACPPLRTSLCPRVLWEY